MKNKKKIFISSAIAVVMVVVSFFGGFFVRSSNYQKETATLDYILSMYKKHFYEQDGKDKDPVDAFCNGLLDSYSDYYTPDEYNVVYQQGQGIKQGIGATISGDTLTITKVLYNSPAERAGVRENDQIIGIKYGDSVFDGGNFQAFTEFYDTIEENVNFTLTLKRGQEVIDVTVMRSQFLETYVRYFDSTGEYGFNDTKNGMEFVRVSDNASYDLMNKSNVAVIKYIGFHADGAGLTGSGGQMKAALERFKSENKTDLIIDLRNNGGGRMDILCDVVRHFVAVEDNQKPLISYAKDKYDKRENFYSDAVDYSKYGFKSIQILANVNSASASEAFIGAVLDYDKDNIASVILEPYYTAQIVGDRVEYVPNFRTYGKGIMQTTFENINGGAIKLTTAGIFWPCSDITIHNKGVTVALNDEAYGGVQKVKNASSMGCVYDAVSSK